LIGAVLTPGQQNDTKLIEFSKPGTDYASIISKIRDLVAE